MSIIVTAPAVASKRHNDFATGLRHCQNFMKPKFKNTLAWQQAELLMQPAFIRILDQVRKQLESTTWKATYQDVQTPLPGYRLCLEQNEATICVDLWELCFQVCFRDYSPSHSELESQEVEIDTSLIDETGDVDWQGLDTKAQHLVEQVFASLPRQGNIL